MLNENELNKLRNTKDDDLLDEFPWFKRSQLRRIKRKLPPEKKSLPKILIFDIETAPIIAYVWQLWEQYVGIDQVKNDWFILSWSAKWLFDDQVLHARLTGSEAKEWDDERIVNKLWKLIDEADIIVAHNLDRFDKLKANTRFLKYWLPHPSPYKTVDTLKVARSNFKVTSNKLDYLCKFLWLKAKTDTWWLDLWKQCLLGSNTALKKMDEYCQNDVLILEEVYLRLRPYIRNHPNVWLYLEWEVCTNCWSSNLRWESSYKTAVSSYDVARCECWAIVRRKSKTSWSTLTSVPN